MKFQSLIITGLLGASFAIPPCRAASVFTIVNTGLPGLASSSVGWGDLNNDGKLDLLLTGTDGSFNPLSQVWRNLGGNGFTNISAGLPGLTNVSSGSVSWGDFDNDGKWDFLQTGFAGLDASHFPILIAQVWRNLGNGAFTNINASLPGTDTGASAWGDFDNDGNLDILLTGFSKAGAIAQIWRNQGGGSFTNISAGLEGVIYSSVALGDFNDDGKVDILLAGTTNGFISGAICQVLRNLGNGAFTNINAGLPGVSQGDVAWGDFDNDGRLDFIQTGFSSTGVVALVWRNLGNGTFANIISGLPGVYQSSVALGDFDNDGNLDVLLSGVDASTNLICQVWRNLGNGTFTNIVAGLPGVKSGSVALADFDNDGRLDVLLTGFDATDSPICQLYHNNTPLGNSLTPRMINPVNRSNGNFEFSFKGKTGLPYLVWSSTNQIAWSVLGVPREASPGSFLFNHGGAGLEKARFYRTTSP